MSPVFSKLRGDLDFAGAQPQAATSAEPAAETTTTTTLTEAQIVASKLCMATFSMRKRSEMERRAATPRLPSTVSLCSENSLATPDYFTSPQSLFDNNNNTRRPVTNRQQLVPHELSSDRPERDKCSHPDCQNLRDVKQHGLCFTHNQQRLRVQRSYEIAQESVGGACATEKKHGISDRERKAAEFVARLFCTGGALGRTKSDKKQCALVNCSRARRKRGMCDRHYQLAMRQVEKSGSRQKRKASDIDE